MALSPDIFKRLSRLNRDLARPKVRPGDRGVASPPAGGRAEAGGAAGAASFEALVPGQERQVRGGKFYAIERRAEEFRPAPGALDGDAVIDGPDLLARYRRLFFGAGLARPETLSDALRTLALADPGTVTYLDIETLGLAGEPLFLVGLMRYRGETLRVDQFLARDYSEERALLGAFWEALAGTQCLVTFNGKTFDVPVIQSRSWVWGLFSPPPLPVHVDLLHEARRRWKRDVPNCRLQTLEEWICGRRRLGDIPGCDIPAAYHDFVRARQGTDPAARARSSRRLQTILHHNALDLVTMAELVTHLLTEQR
jgi:hypothetical protein